MKLDVTTILKGVSREVFKHQDTRTRVTPKKKREKGGTKKQKVDKATE